MADLWISQSSGRRNGLPHGTGVVDIDGLQCAQGEVLMLQTSFFGVRRHLLRGCVIPAHPLALASNRHVGVARQRGLDGARDPQGNWIRLLGKSCL